MGGSITIGPECFVYEDGSVISWKGQEYVKTCGEFVVDLPNGGRAFCTLSYDHPDLIHVNTGLGKQSVPESPASTGMKNLARSIKEAFPSSETVQEESNLVKHARRELELVGEDEDVIAWFLDTIQAFASYGHSGGSSMATIPVLEKLLRFENLTQLTDDPDEWVHHNAEMWDGKTGIWQNKRNSKMFSRDQGKTYWNVDSSDKKIQHTFSAGTKFQGAKRPKIEGLY